ncbi:hypothetical protein GGF37_001807 [Kickxella alabastrina]|nr:hypothetical protein GGF37_001807 [Kickxella alabastrina]
MADAYEYGVAHGPLKLKKSKGLFKKTKTTSSSSKRKSKSSSTRKNPKSNPHEQDHSDAESAALSGDDTRNAQDIVKVIDRTDAEKRHDEILKKRKLEHVEKLAEKSYRDRIKEFNDKLERAPEHHDMPKVGPG